MYAVNITTELFTHSLYMLRFLCGIIINYYYLIVYVPHKLFYLFCNTRISERKDAANRPPRQAAQSAAPTVAPPVSTIPSVSVTFFSFSLQHCFYEIFLNNDRHRQIKRRKIKRKTKRTKKRVLQKLTYQGLLTSSI